jgi:hypothetical protein
MKNLDFICDSVKAESQIEKRFIQYCAEHNITDLQINDTIQINNKKYLIAGLSEDNFIILNNKKSNVKITFDLVNEFK